MKLYGRPSPISLIVVILSIVATIVIHYEYQAYEERQIVIQNNHWDAWYSLWVIAAHEDVIRWQQMPLPNEGVRYWTADVAGLYDHDNPGNFWKVLADADCAPVQAIVPTPIPYKGYFFIAMDDFKENRNGFSFCAYPEVYGVTGKLTFCVNLNDTINVDNGGKPILTWPVTVVE